MTAIALSIVEPRHDTVFVPSTPVKLQGAPVSLPPELADVPLYYRWYSSLHLAPAPPFSLIPTSDPTVAQAPVLVAGSHAVTLAVTDRASEDAGAQKEVRHGGVTGGAVRQHPPGELPTPCVIHVLRAVIIRPALPPKETWKLSRAAPAIDVEGTREWITEKYRPINRLRYHFVFQAKTPNAGPIDYLPDPGGFTGPDGDYHGPWSVTAPNVLRVGEPLPAALKPGAYTLRLRVEDLHGTMADETGPLDVTVTA
jgi:hypothetical protein